MRSAFVYNFLIEANIMASIAIILMIPLRKFFRKQLGNSAICFGWLLVAIRLLCPLSLVNPLIHTIRSPFAADTAIRPIAGQIKVRISDALGDLSSLFWRADNQSAYEVTNRLQVGMENASTSITLAKVWLAGVLLIVAWFLFSNIRFRLRLRADRIDRISGELLEQYEALCRRRHIKPVPVYFTDPLPSACLVGVFRPYIALPLSASPQDVIHVLTHEICHIKNKDHLWGILRLLCCAIHWFNPLVWIAVSMSRTDSELRCDDRVTQPMNQEERKSYASVLVLAAARRNAPGLGVLATGMTMTGRRLKGRVLMIVQKKQPLRWLVLSFMVLSSMLLLGSFATSETQEQIGERAYELFTGELTLSGRENAVLSADEALREKYGITQLGQEYFNRSIEQQDENVYVVTYEGLEDYAFVLGKYTVTVDRNTVTDIRWSHDGESTEGGFDADAWGTDQILEMLRMNQEDGVTDAFDVYVREINRRNGHVYQPKVQSDEEIEAEDRQREQEIQEAQRLSSLTPSKMMGIARQAIISLYHLSDAQADHLTVYPPTTEEEEEWAYSMRNGEPCYEVLIGLDSEAGITITEGEVQYTEGTGNYWVFVNTQTGTVEEIYYSLGIGGNG